MQIRGIQVYSWVVPWKLCLAVDRPQRAKKGLQRGADFVNFVIFAAGKYGRGASSWPGHNFQGTTKMLVVLAVFALCACPALASLHYYSWEDEGTVLGFFGTNPDESDAMFATNVGAPDPTRTGSRSLRLCLRNCVSAVWLEKPGLKMTPHVSF